MRKVHAFAARSLNGQSHEFFYIRLACSQQCGDDLSALAGELIPVANVDFFDNPVGTQARQCPRHASTLPKAFPRLRTARIQSRAHVSIAEAAQGPLAPADNLEQPRVRFRPRVDPAIAPTVLVEGLAYRARQISHALAGAHAGEGFQIASIDRLAKLGSPVQVADALAQHLPAFLALRVAFTRSIDPKLMGTVERRFDSEHAALLIVEFDGVTIGLVFEAQRFGPMLETAQDFALVIAMYSAIGLGLVPKEKQDIGAAKVLEP